MESRDYATASLAELDEELERLARLSASPETLQTTFDRSADAMRSLISSESKPWLEERLAEVADKFCEPMRQTGIEDKGDEPAACELVELIAAPLANVLPEDPPDSASLPA